MGLEEYNLKRKFDKTPEPKGIGNKENASRFVVQRHKASRLHYDLRLEIEGVLKSWAVPKGPSMNASDKRLAIQTEDHPVRYLTFEGTIPRGNYGAGVMQIWDTGIFEVTNASTEKELIEQYEKGDLKITFHGEKIKGAFALVKTNRSGKQNQWLLIKKKDAFATDLEYDAEWFTDDKATKSSEPDKKSAKKKLDPGSFIKPMLASPTKEIFDSPDWIYELKWDGYRILAHISEGKASLYSRNGLNYSQKFRPITYELSSIPHEVVLDGEVVIVNEEGLPDFQKLQNYDPETTEGTLRFYVFDLLHLNGMDAISLPLTERKSLLPEILEDLNRVIYCDHLNGMGSVFYNRAIEAGMEGVIAKKADSTYSPGYRSENWLKVKSVESVEVLICGYTDSVKGGSLFGSLILGTYREGELKYAGNCGSGFSNEEQRKLLDKFSKLETEKNPFGKKINLKGRKPHWAEPKIICEVKYSEITKSGLMRHPIYKGIRNDKDQAELAPPEEVESQENELNTTKNTQASGGSLEIGGQQITLTNLEKIYWPDEGFRKYDLIDYYLNISEIILPYLVDRPQNMHRHPNGIKGKSFYQKDNETLPGWIETYPIYSKSTRKEIEYMLCQNEASLLYMANLGCIEINPWNSRVQSLDSPDFTVIDVDPTDKNTFEEVIEVAMAAKEVLDLAGIEGYCKTSGSSGMHIYIPLGAKYSYEEARDFTKLLCYYIHAQTDPLTSMDRAVKNRKGKIYLDYLQNRRGQTLAAPYCARPKPGATVSAPLLWEEVKPGLDRRDFTILSMPPRIEEKGDLFAAVLEKGIDMEKALARLEDT
ncbi:DNA ligase D [Marivirga sp. S37H4]|uniref:DNA ligase (ATP) n=1 Tax=Marivirga aurantiaca TaxID=2802615 RepID=A0A935C7G7_9BACT|nr:DNA ligase D [Marivirga aurantiaca]MBK6264357.1 DNA ligase D [Marivirga aurantiaca]